MLVTKALWFGSTTAGLAVLGSADPEPQRVKKQSPKLTSHINTAISKPSSVFLRPSLAVTVEQ